MSVRVVKPVQNLLQTEIGLHDHLLDQWSSNLAREIHFPAEFSSNPDQTHYLWFSNDPEDID